MASSNTVKADQYGATAATLRRVASSMQDQAIKEDDWRVKNNLTLAATHLGIAAGEVEDAQKFYLRQAGWTWEQILKMNAEAEKA